MVNIPLLLVRTVWLFGEPRVNVLTLNLALDALRPLAAPAAAPDTLAQPPLNPDAAPQSAGVDSAATAP